ncbi:MAG: L-threonylcarbamoyladenylate synthase [Pseudomonadota bacterium]
MIKSANEKSIQEAAEIIKGGGLVGMPTETVYGLAADATNGEAVAKIYAAKGRPSFNPLIVHVTSLEQAAEFAEITNKAETLAHHFWPGPVTFVLKQKPNNALSELATAGLGTVAVRVPAHMQARQFLQAATTPIVAPSANKSGALSPTTPAHVEEGLGEEVDMILAAGSCQIGLESTVIDLSNDTPQILRPGAITAEDISHVLEMDIGYAEPDDDSPKSPGMLLKHYAPNTPVRLNAIDLEAAEALLAFGSTKFMGIKGGGAAADLPEAQWRNLSDNQDLHEAASNLFKMLKELDKGGFKTIAVMQIPETGLGVAINDRLRRAAESR